MKARNHNRRILNDSLDLNIATMETSSFLTEEVISYVAAGNAKIEELLMYMQKAFADAKEPTSYFFISSFACFTKTGSFSNTVSRIEVYRNTDSDGILRF